MKKKFIIFKFPDGGFIFLDEDSHLENDYKEAFIDVIKDWKSKVSISFILQ